VRRLAVVVVLAAFVAGCGDDGSSQPASTSSPSFRIERGVAYGRGEVADGEVPLLLDLYRPDGEVSGGRPVVVIVHGGGFASQSRTDAGVVEIARGLAGRGIVVASIDYRLLPQVPVPSDRVEPLLAALPQLPIGDAMAAAIDDTLTAVDWLTANADELGLDVERLGIVGSSAGALTGDAVAYALDDHGVDGPTVTWVGSLWGGIVLQSDRPDGNGAVQLDAGEAALFAVHGDADTTLPVILSDQLAARAEAEGVPVEYHRLPGAEHGHQASGFFTAPVDGDRTAFELLLASAENALQP
jgi:acetyl esterase/lipase